MDKEVIEGILFLKPSGIEIEKLNDIDINSLIEEINNKYKDTVLYVRIKDNRLVMEIKPEYIDKIAKYYEDRELSDSQLKILGLIKLNGKLPKSEAIRKLSKNEFIELLNKGFIKIEKIERREYLILGSKYYEYFQDKNVKS